MGSKLQKVATEKGFTVDRLCQETGIEKARIEEYWTASRSLLEEDASAIARVLDVPVSTIERMSNKFTGDDVTWI